MTEPQPKKGLSVLTIPGEKSDDAPELMVYEGRIVGAETVDR
jgi:hypothetical protein